MKTAVIGIGSNSVRMLLADIQGNTGIRLGREREGTRLFAGLDAHNRLSRSAMEKTAAAVAAMASSAQENGAEEFHLFATSATRDAVNSDELADLLRQTSGLELEITPGTEEALLSYLGASGGGVNGVIDIGGGSTEIIIGHAMDVDCAFSCQMGAVRLQRMLPISKAADLAAVRVLAAQLLQEHLASYEGLSIPDTWYGTGGTFTTLAAMVRQVSWTDRSCIHGTVLTAAQVSALAETLADMSVEERKLLPGLQPNRADIVVHGMCILLSCMQALHIDRISVSEYGNLDGYIKKAYWLTGGLRNA